MKINKLRKSKYFLPHLILALFPILTHAASAPNPKSGHIIAKTPLQRLQVRIQQSMAQIQRDVKLGKLTQDQAKSLKTQIAGVQKQESSELKQGGSGTLTDAQLSQLNQQLNTISKSIPIK